MQQLADLVDAVLLERLLNADGELRHVRIVVAAEERFGVNVESDGGVVHGLYPSEGAVSSIEISLHVHH